MALMANLDLLDFQGKLVPKGKQEYLGLQENQVCQDFQEWTV